MTTDHKRQFVVSIIIGLVLLFVSLVINFYAGTYANNSVSNPVTDIILDNIPTFDVDMIFVYGPFIMWAFVAILCLQKPQRIPLVLKSIAIFVIVRSFFVTLTHIGPFPTEVIVDYTSDFVKKFTFGGDLFFSSHTGLPYLMALVFWDDRNLRAFFILCAVFFGAIVLMGHLHYSIDVLGAFFITFTIYHIVLVFFPKDKKLFDKGFVRTEK